MNDKNAIPWKRFRKRPVVIDALELTDEILDASHPDDRHIPGVTYDPVNRHATIRTLEGVMAARVGDWIIKGVKGKLYPCKPDIFEATYEAAEAVENAVTKGNRATTTEAATDWPPTGERVYVHEPKLPMCSLTANIRGWATVINTDYDGGRGLEVCVDPERPWESNDEGYRRKHDWWVRRAACHREEPQGKPPSGDAVFLGRHETPDGKEDFWWGDGRVGARSYAGWTSVEIDEGEPHKPWRLSFRAALARARVLGLCPPAASPESKEPERPEPKFQVGQVCEHGPGDNIIVTRICAVHRDVFGGQWVYTMSNGLGVIESGLRPHAMTLADVPDATIRAVLGCKPVKVVERPVDITGLPYGDGSKEPDWQSRGKPISCLPRIHGCVAMMPDGGMVWLWNLEPARD